MTFYFKFLTQLQCLGISGINVANLRESREQSDLPSKIFGKFLIWIADFLFQRVENNFQRLDCGAPGGSRSMCGVTAMQRTGNGKGTWPTGLGTAGHQESICSATDTTLHVVQVLWLSLHSNRSSLPMKKQRLREANLLVRDHVGGSKWTQTG